MAQKNEPPLKSKKDVWKIMFVPTNEAIQCDTEWLNSIVACYPALLFKVKMPYLLL